MEYYRRSGDILDYTRRGRGVRVPINHHTGTEQLYDAGEERILGYGDETGAERTESELVLMARRLEEAEDRWKRSAAELDNARKRFSRELEKQQALEREAGLRPWLGVIDNLERAIAAAEDVSNPWTEGMKAIHRQMLDVLRGFDAAPFRPNGEPFDPERHEAVATVESNGEPEGTIVEVVLPGYTIGERLLRAAKVVTVRDGGRTHDKV